MTGSLVVRAMALLSSAAAIGCTPAHAPTNRGQACLHYKPVNAIPSEERRALEDGALSWRNVGVCVDEEPGDVAIIRVATAAEVPAAHRAWFLKGGDNGPFLAFWEPRERAIYYVVDRIGGDEFRTMFVHELGHALGSPHLKELGNCMHPVLYADLCAPFGRVTPQDLAAIDQKYVERH